MCENYSGGPWQKWAFQLNGGRAGVRGQVVAAVRLKVALNLESVRRDGRAAGRVEGTE